MKSTVLFLLLAITINAQDKRDVYTQAQYDYIDSKYTNEYQKCINSVNSATHDILKCMENEFIVHDTLLNENYKMAMKNIEPARKENLKKMQRLWMKYIDAKCGFYYHEKSGSGGLQSSSECKIAETIFRSDELAELR